MYEDILNILNAKKNSVFLNKMITNKPRTPYNIKKQYCSEIPQNIKYIIAIDENKNVLNIFKIYKNKNDSKIIQNQNIDIENKIKFIIKYIIQIPTSRII